MGAIGEEEVNGTRADALVVIVYLDGIHVGIHHRDDAPLVSYFFVPLEKVDTFENAIIRTFSLVIDAKFVIGFLVAVQTDADIETVPGK